MSLLCRFQPAWQITPEEYAEAGPDPIYQFSGPVGGHMNDDHADATRAMIKHYVGITGVRRGSAVAIEQLASTGKHPNLGGKR